MTQSIAEFLKSHEAKGAVSFHMPGHKGRIIDEAGFSVRPAWDITEISGADNLFQPEGVIAETMAKYRRLYGSRRSYLLINGSSGGIIAAVLASVKRGGKLIMARNCHKSVFNSLMLADVSPVYVHPETVEEYGIQGEVSPAAIEDAISRNPEAEAVILPSPNYYGICSDIKAIASVVHRYGKILIVDQAHGAHLKMMREQKRLPLAVPEAAEDSGADIVINSTHKTLASLTQTAVLNVCSDRVDLPVLEDKLQMMESSSPSYPLMASLDINADLLITKGDRLINVWLENLAEFYKETAKIDGLKIMSHDNLDPTKINLDMSLRGFDGMELEKFLIDRGIFAELVTGNIVMCMTGIGNTAEDYGRLARALGEAAAAGGSSTAGERSYHKALTKTPEQRAIPISSEEVPLREAAGRVCASSVIPYPPGIPIVCPGEVIDEETAAYIIGLREAGEKVIGVSEEMKVRVGR